MVQTAFGLSRAQIRFLGRQAGLLGARVFAVGGCVRDRMLGFSTKDLDICVEGDPKPLARAFLEKWGGVSESFDRFGTLRVFLKSGFRLDFARTRLESYPSPAALPEVAPAATIEEDLKRRDFSINAMAVELGPEGLGRLLDPFGGYLDLRDKRLRVLHEESFRDDPTRIYRAARFASRLSMRLESKTEAWLRDAAAKGYPALLSRERVAQELLRILEEKRPAGALGLLERWKITRYLWPNLKWKKADFRPKDPDVTLGVMACLQGSKKGKLFLESLRLRRPLAQAIRAALELMERKRSSPHPLEPLAVSILHAAAPRLPVSALKPVWVTGQDIARLGRAPGPAYKAILDAAACLQWAGKLSSRRQALLWLRKYKKI